MPRWGMAQNRLGTTALETHVEHKVVLTTIVYLGKKCGFLHWWSFNNLKNEHMYEIKDELILFCWYYQGGCKFIFMTKGRRITKTQRTPGLH